MNYNSYINEKIELWKKVNTDLVNIKEYLLMAFSNEESIFVNQIDKVETENHIIRVLTYERPYNDLNKKTWLNRRYKFFYFTRHEYGDLFELDYIPLENGWKLHFSTTRIEYQSCLDFITLSHIENTTPDIQEEFKWDCLDIKINDEIIMQIKESFAKVLTKSKITKNCNR